MRARATVWADSRASLVPARYTCTRQLCGVCGSHCAMGTCCANHCDCAATAAARQSLARARLAAAWTSEARLRLARHGGCAHHVLQALVARVKARAVLAPAHVAVRLRKRASHLGRRPPHPPLP